MNNRAGTFSPISDAGSSEWSGISRYQNDSPYPQGPPNNRGNLATPPISGSSNGAPPPANMDRRPGGNPSPPNSVGRSSYGTNASGRRTVIMEENLAHHYNILRRYLAQSLRDEKGNVRPNRARDKLLRLSAVQFQELSTDVFDELQRRQAQENPRQPPNSVPPYLLPKDTFHPKRNQARQKLATLPPSRFRDLATDVFYELERRFPHFAGRRIDRTGSPNPNMIGPPSRQGTPNGYRPGSRGGPGGPGGPPPPYNARSASLAGGGPGPPGPDGPNEPVARPTAKTFQSNMMVPNKSTMVEDDDTGTEDNGSDAYNSRRQTSNSYRSFAGNERFPGLAESKEGELRGRIGELETLVREKDLEINKLQESSRQEKVSDLEKEHWNSLQAKLEKQLQDALQLNKNLESEIDRARQQHEDSKQHLQDELDRAVTQSGDNEWKSRYENLEKAQEQLQRELRQQETVSREVRQEAQGFLSEMKMLSERSNQSSEREDKLLQQVHRLEDEVRTWKERYAQSHSQHSNLSSLPASSIKQPDMAHTSRNAAYITQNGLIKHIHVAKFQVAMDALLANARQSEPQSVLTQVKAVVIAVRSITQDAARGPELNEEISQQKQKITAKLAATANNFITASKNFALANGLSPISLLDAAASHLSSSVIELVRLVKMCPTPAGEGAEADDDDNSLIAESPAAYYGGEYNRISAGADSIYSTLSPKYDQVPPVPSINQVNQNTNTTNSGPTSAPYQNGLHAQGYTVTKGSTFAGIRSADNEADELKSIVEDQMDALVQSIQSLVDSIRSSQDAQTVRAEMHEMISIFANVVNETKHTASTTTDKVLLEQINPVVKVFGGLNKRLLDIGTEADSITDAAKWKEFAKKIPPMAFEVARETKELVSRLDAVASGTHDDFR